MKSVTIDNVVKGQTTESPMRGSLFFTILAIAISGLPAVSQDFDTGQRALESGDYSTALREFRPLAEQGYAIAQNDLGFMYENGKGVPKDDAEAMRWFRLAAGQGEASAQDNFGVMFATGRGAPQNNVAAHMWFDLASTAGAEKGRANRDHVAALMTPAEIAEAQRRAKICLESNYADCD